MPITMERLRRYWNTKFDMTPEEHEQVETMCACLGTACSELRRQGRDDVADKLSECMRAGRYLNQPTEDLCVYAYNEEPTKEQELKAKLNEREMAKSIKTMNGIRDLLNQRNEDGISLYEEVVDICKKKGRIQSEGAFDNGLATLDEHFDYKLDIEDVSKEYSRKAAILDMMENNTIAADKLKAPLERDEDEQPKKKTWKKQPVVEREKPNYQHYQALAYLLEDKEKNGELYQEFANVCENIDKKCEEVAGQAEKDPNNNELKIDNKFLPEFAKEMKELKGAIDTVSQDSPDVPREERVRHAENAAECMRKFWNTIHSFGGTLKRCFQKFAELWDDKEEKFGEITESKQLSKAYAFGDGDLKKVREEQKLKYASQKYLQDIEANSWDEYLNKIKAAENIKGMEPEYLSRAMVANMYNNSEQDYSKEKLEEDSRKLRESPVFMKLAKENPQYLGKLLQQGKVLDAYAAVTSPISFVDPLTNDKEKELKEARIIATRNKLGDADVDDTLKYSDMENLSKFKNVLGDSPRNGANRETWDLLLQKLDEIEPEKTFKRAAQAQVIYDLAKDCLSYPKRKKANDDLDWNKSNEAVLGILGIVAKAGPMARVAVDAVIKEHNRRAGEYGINPVDMKELTPKKLLGKSYDNSSYPNFEPELDLQSAVKSL